jgi:hypothetical protein
MLVLREGALFDIGPELLEGRYTLPLQPLVFGAEVAVEFGVARLMATRRVCKSACCRLSCPRQAGIQEGAQKRLFQKSPL